MVVVIFLNNIHVIPDALRFFNTNNRIRETLGFNYYAFAEELFFYFVCSYIVLRKNKISYFELVLLEIVNCFILQMQEILIYYQRFLLFSLLLLRFIIRKNIFFELKF
ncbi:hypothetical protein EFR95_07135 [Lactobacillus amylovorus]|uniref:hypothetical protein n=1 Tax=Lactobacillus amylovorus TaxID=1604 RepID=UPI0021A3AA75|nr:hypothetical protein [Lactobacillus amylovorus]MCT3586106.1 hypothetical protein [Lactobacillus amylovorus]